MGIILVVPVLQVIHEGVSKLVAPLIDLTKKLVFIWIEESQREFNKLKEVMTTCLELALPEFI